MSVGARIDFVLRAMTLLQNGPAIDYGRDVISQGSGGHGKHGMTSAAPSWGGEKPLVEEWSDRIEAVVMAAERDLHEARRGASVRDFTGIKRRIRSPEYEGRDVVWVAFVERCSTDLVRKERRSARLDPDGFPLPTPFTAPPPKRERPTPESTTTTEEG